MRAIVLLALLAACGGGANEVNPAGRWLLTDTPWGGCSGVGSTETVNVTEGGSIDGYSMIASWCDSKYCELQGVKAGVTRDLVFYADGTAGGNRSSTACAYSTRGARQ